MVFKKNKIIIEYSVYFFSAFLRIIILLTSAKFFDDKTFILFNVYVAIIDLAVIIINSSSLNYLLVNNHDRITPLIGENIFSFLFLFFSFFFFSENLSIIFYLFLMVFFKINLNLCCRYLQVNNKIIESLIYNFFGNSVWIVIAIFYYALFNTISLKVFFLTWISTLLVTCSVFYLNYPISLTFNIKIVFRFLKFYIQNFHFSFMFSSFLNVERLIYFKLFNSFPLLSTYTIFTKITNLIYELTYGFFVHKKVARNFDLSIYFMIPIIILLNIMVYVVFNIDLVNDILKKLFSGKLYKEHYDLLQYILLSMTFLTILRIFYIDLIKIKLFKKLLFIVCFIYISFVFIIYFKVSIYNAILIETVFLAIACIISFKIINNEAVISNKK